MPILSHRRTTTISTEGVAASSTIILYARHPRPGAVKTRLARDIGDEAAAAVYAHLLDHALAELRTLASRMRVVIDAASQDDVPPLRDRAPWVADVRTQCTGDIGERMAHGLGRA
ncbi:MAG: hypothetical protein KFF77_08830, partial [Bacteroidetes bacterium]|nr:hypothetical protein [Bacteroidota bacterium]